MTRGDVLRYNLAYALIRASKIVRGLRQADRVRALRRGRPCRGATPMGRLERVGRAKLLIRLAVEKSGEEYLSFPQRALFDKLGIRTMRIETDPFGNFLGQGYEVGCGRDWARLGNLYLQDGVWNGERILPAGYTKFVSTPAPAWIADKRPIYGALFWINGAGQSPVPRESYYMAGAGGQTTMIVPSHDLVVVRLGHIEERLPELQLSGKRSRS